MANVTVPEGEGNLRSLMLALEDLHRRAGRPSLRVMAEGQSFSYGSVHTLFAKTRKRVPAWRVLRGVVTVLADHALGSDPDQLLNQFHVKWVDAERQPFTLESENTAAILPTTELLARKDKMQHLYHATHGAPKSDDLETIRSTGGFSLAITQVREEAGLSIRQVAQITDLTLTTLSSFYNGRRQPTWPQLEQILTACDVPVEDHAVWLEVLLRLRRVQKERRSHLQGSGAIPPKARQELADHLDAFLNIWENLPESAKTRGSSAFIGMNNTISEALRILQGEDPTDAEILEDRGLWTGHRNGPIPEPFVPAVRQLVAELRDA